MWMDDDGRSTAPDVVEARHATAKSILIIGEASAVVPRGRKVVRINLVENSVKFIYNKSKEGGQYRISRGGAIDCIY